MKKKDIIIATIVFLLAASMIFILLNIVSIKLIGNKLITLELYETYEEAGAIACLNTIKGCKNISKNIKITNNVNINKPGKYKVEYKIDYGILKKKVTRKVNVIDNQEPIITLKGNTIVSQCPNTEYKEEGYEVTDNYTRNIKVKIKTKDNNIIYTAVDSSGNKATAKRTITYEDTVAPSITVNNNDYVLLGTSYNLNNITAMDNCDGDITNKVTIEGSVNSNIQGTYNLSYTVSDSSNNHTTINKTVKVFPKNTANNNVTNKIIYLTFDDGPSRYTDELLGILDKYNVKATFFITANHGYEHLIPKINNAGHVVAAHSYTHDYNKIYKSIDAYFSDLDLINNQIYKYTGKYPKLIRFPGGSSNLVSKFNPGIMSKLAQEVENRGYQYFDWNIDSGDVTNSNPNTIATNVINNLGNGNYVVLQHDTVYASVQAVEQIIQYGLINGYTFLPLNEYSYKAHHNIKN